MQALELKVYEILKAKFSEPEATTLIEYFEKKSEEKLKENDIILKTDITSLKSEMDKLFVTKENLANVKSDIIKWMFIFWVGQIGVLIAILTIFFK